MLVGTVVNSCRASLLPYHPGGLLSVVSYRWITLRVYKFNARWYGGKQLSCEFVTIPSWRAGICGKLSLDYTACI